MVYDMIVMIGKIGWIVGKRRDDMHDNSNSTVTTFLDVLFRIDSTKNDMYEKTN